MSHAIKKILDFYQKNISPRLVWVLGGAGGCRFYPACSEYTRQAISKYGLIRGIGWGGRRILKCHPWSAGGVDLI